MISFSPGCVAGGVLNGSAGHSPPPSLGFNRKCGFVLLPPELHGALKDRVEMLIRHSGVDPEITRCHSCYCGYIGVLLKAG